MTRSILVVDDEKGQREILQTILEKEGYRVACVAGGTSIRERSSLVSANATSGRASASSVTASTHGHPASARRQAAD